MIQIQQLGGFRVAVNPKVAGLLSIPPPSRGTVKLKRRRQPISEKSVQIGASWKGSKKTLRRYGKSRAWLGCKSAVWNLMRVSWLSSGPSPASIISIVARWNTVSYFASSQTATSYECSSDGKEGVFGGNGPNGELGCWIESLVSGGPAANSDCSPENRSVSGWFQIRTLSNSLCTPASSR